ncbi:cell surface glycoprotein [Natronorubrum sp. JWXQ-INN-674]|uniref:Cell surface glycoprotein n=1 Tax=Natronorubrum halalkaliphilum TaxID=2691917 RepID=A0A6B0VS31_9EURY|nr:cell surface glycoprotein [Natronorubrum halalkaliphilum]MXV63786.1 cell surface glycoprotein [Natronorubrum halalkaliphilum]
MTITGSVAAGPALVVADSDDYDLSVPGATDTPPQTVSVGDSTHEVSALATVDYGDSLAVDVTAPEGTDFDVDLYNSDSHVETFESGSGTERVTFDTDDVDPGSYMLALYIDGNHVDIFPVVIASHDVTTSHPTEVNSDGEVTIDTTVSEISSAETLSGVEVAVWNDDTVIRNEATATGDDSYQLTISGSQLEEGESYNVYAIAQGTDEVEGEPEALGVSYGSTLTVTDSDDSDEDDDDKTDDNGDSEEDETDEGETDSEGSDYDGTDEEENETDDTQNETNQSEQSDDTDDNVVQPNTDDDEDDESDADSVPVLGVQFLLLGTLFIGLVCRTIVRT